MNKVKRQDFILQKIISEGNVSVNELATQFNVSAMTIRRDLSELSRKGSINRCHGGALPTRESVVEFMFKQRVELHSAEKKAIAKVIASMISPGMTVGFDTGTTTLEVTKLLTDYKNITVLTTSLTIAAALHSVNDIEVILLGGNMRKNSPDLIGPITESNINRFHIDMAVLGADAVRTDGAYTTDVRIAGISKAFCDNADKIVLAVDSSKFHAAGVIRCVDMDDIDCIVTDEFCPQSVREWLEKKVEHVIYAPVDKKSGYKILCSDK